MPTTVLDERYARAGKIAGAWYRRFEPKFRYMTTAEYRATCDELLDAALMDVGLIPAELPRPRLCVVCDDRGCEFCPAL